MLDDRARSRFDRPGDANDVETYGGLMEAATMKVLHCGTSDAALFAKIDGFPRRPVRIGSPRLYFDEDEQRAFTGDEIELAQG